MLEATSSTSPNFLQVLPGLLSDSMDEENNVCATVVRKQEHVVCDYNATNGRKRSPLHYSFLLSGLPLLDAVMVDDKYIGLALAVSESVAIGTSFIITKKVCSSYVMSTFLLRAPSTTLHSLIGESFG